MTKRNPAVKSNVMTCPYCEYEDPSLWVSESNQGREQCERCQKEFYCECKLTFITRCLREYEKEELEGETT